MSQDTQDQGTPSALRPRPGWDKSARNPEAVHGSLDTASIPSTGYMDPSYQPVRGPMQTQSDAGELDQSLFAERQQGHRLSRTNSPSRAGGAGGTAGVGELDVPVPADGRPAWDSRFHLVATAWEAQPRTILLRPPSTNAFPGSGGGVGGSLRQSMPALQDGYGRSVLSDSGSPGPRQSCGIDSMDREGGHAGSTLQVTVDGYGSRTTILPGLYATSPPLRPSPYAAPQPSGPVGAASGAASGAAAGPQSPKPDRATSGPPAVRQPHVDIDNSYVGWAYSPWRGYDGFSADGSGSGSPSKQESGTDGRRARGTDGAEADDEGGVDGHGTHLPALDRVYYRRQEPAVQQSDSKADKSPYGSRVSIDKPRKPGKATPMPGAVYMPKKVASGENLALERPSPQKPVSAPSPLGSRPHYMSPAKEASGGSTSDPVGGFGGHEPSDRFTGGGPTWRPSGRQPIPEAAPPVPCSGRKKHEGGQEDKVETQEEADRRRAAPRRYSPDRYPLVGQGWFLAPEKFPPNPAYAGVRAKYMEARPPRSDPEDSDSRRGAVHMPDIHTKPWLNPGKHLVTDSSAPPARISGAVGARPVPAVPPSISAAGEAASMRRPNRGAAKGAKSSAGSAGARRSGKQRGCGRGSGSEVEADREEVLAVIGGVRLMSINKRDKMADEAEDEAEEDAEFAAEDVEGAGQQVEEARDASNRAADGTDKDEEAEDEHVGSAPAGGVLEEDEGRERAQDGPRENWPSPWQQQPTSDSSSSGSSSSSGTSRRSSRSSRRDAGARERSRGNGSEGEQGSDQKEDDGNLPFGGTVDRESASGVGEEEEEQEKGGSGREAEDAGDEGYGVVGDDDDDDDDITFAAADEEGEDDVNQVDGAEDLGDDD